jgi:3-hydroxyisobutyrate dehydrogenase-like beta-hydroxyacid dehydrogenase
MEKDYDLALNIARQMDVALPAAAMTRQFWGGMIARQR